MHRKTACNATGGDDVPHIERRRVRRTRSRIDIGDSVPVTGTGYNAYLGGFDYAANGNIIAYSGKDVLRSYPSRTGRIALHNPDDAGEFVRQSRPAFR